MIEPMKHAVQALGWMFRRFLALHGDAGMDGWLGLFGRVAEIAGGSGLVD